MPPEKIAESFHIHCLGLLTERFRKPRSVFGSGVVRIRGRIYFSAIKSRETVLQMIHILGKAIGLQRFRDGLVHFQLAGMLHGCGSGAVPRKVDALIRCMIQERTNDPDLINHFQRSAVQMLSILPSSERAKGPVCRAAAEYGLLIAFSMVVASLYSGFVPDTDPQTTAGLSTRFASERALVKLPAYWKN